MAYRIQFTDDGLNDVKSLPKNVRNSLAKELKNKLAPDPVGCSEELRDPLAGWRSYHYGNYRVVFRFDQDLQIIAVAGIGKHSSQAVQDIYKKLELLAKQGRLAESVLATLRGFSAEKK
ncbi:MAG: type II toxin-antitoxin system RelE/ParE family toxin [Acidobacteriia bacterium]|nr:type II toxin-antitoxin system RelE/ParE family toxin [Terriglobia bacterium]